MDYFTKPKPEPPAFFFDLYGTLVDITVDEERPAFWENLASAMGGEVDPQRLRRLYAMVKRDAEAALPAGGEINLEHVFLILLETFSCRTPLHAFARYFRDTSVLRRKLYPNRKKILERLHARGAQVYLVADAQRCYAMQELATLGIQHHFDGILLSSEVGYTKPAPQLFQAAFSRFSATPETTVYVGNDLVDDVAAARALGMRSVYIETAQSGVYADPPPVDILATERTLSSILCRLAEGKPLA